MNKILILLFILTFILGCQNKAKCNLDNQILKSNDSIILKVKSDKTLTKLLVKMEDTQLEASKNESYRFMILGAWGGKQFYKIVNDSDNITIASKGYWNYYDDIEVDSLGYENIRKIHITDWLEIKNSLDELNFWSLPVRVIDDLRVLDGASYVIEGYNTEKNECTNRNYHITARISPSDSTLYKSIFKKVIKLGTE
jgi:hypothetical protein